MAVWLAGFFGSGKSHVAKVLGHLLENDVIEPESNRRAIDLFDMHLDDPTLPNASELKKALAQIRNQAYCETIAFEIKARLDQANPESVTEICLRSFYERLGLSSTVWLARLERKLQAEGYYDDFLRAYREHTGREWFADRPEHGFYLEEMVSALAAARRVSQENAQQMISAYQRDHARVTPEGFAGELVGYLESHAAEVKPREPHVIFVIDEMGQFIGDSGDRIHELQSIIEQAGAQGRGRIWFICTSQEALDQVVDRTGLKLSALGKLDARFSIKVPLTSEDIRRVVQDRLLRKREVALPELEELYTAKEGLIEDLSALRLERKLATVSSDSFVSAYPFLPHSVPLVQELFNAMRGFKLSGTERSMIALVQGTLQSLSDRPVGVVAPLDLIFDQVTDELSSTDYLGTTGIKLIRESDEQVPGTPVAASRVLKALWLISRVSWVPRTPEVLAKLLAEDLDEDLGRLRNAIQETLDRLQKAGLVGRDEASGQYRYLSEKERGIEEAIADKIGGYGVGVARRRATELLKARVLTRAKWNDFRVAFGKSGVLPFSLSLDEEAVTSAGEIELRLFSPLANARLDEIESENMARGSKGRVIWWVADEESTLVDKLKRLEALEKVPQEPEWRNDRSDETVRVVKEKERERAALENHAVGLLEKCLMRGLRGTPPGSMAGYSRDEFPHWSSDAASYGWMEPDGSCDVRDAALIRDGRGVRIDEDCDITAGTWPDPYTGRSLTDSSEVDIDHVVPLASAWRFGASSAAWSTADREAYANDPEVLLSADAGANRTKGDKGPEAWKPPNQDYWCEYARRWIWIKSDWDLTVNPAEKLSLRQMLATCRAG